MCTWSERVIARMDADENPTLSRRARRKILVSFLIARRLMTRRGDKGMKRNLRNLERTHARMFSEIDKTLKEVEELLHGNKARGTGKRMLRQSSR